MAVNRFPSKDIDFQIDNAAGAPQVLTGLTSVDGLPGPKEHIESTAIGDNSWNHIESVERVEFTLEGWYDRTATTGTGIVLAEIRDTANYEGTFIFGPHGNGSGAAQRTGECVMVDYVETVRLGDVVGFRAVFRAQTVITFTTYA